MKKILFFLILIFSSDIFLYDRLTGKDFATRSEVIATNGMAATSHPLATQTALDVLKDGGNAIDAAIAANAVLGLVEPTGCGIGGDLFAIVWIEEDKKLYGLNSSGPAPQDMTIEKLKATRIGHGIRSIESQDLVKLLKQRQVLLELCPTSNVHTKTVDSIKNHPVSKFYNEGVPISIGDDDPITSRTSVSRELTILENNFGFGIKDIIAIQKMSIEAAFITDQRLKNKLLRTVSSV